MGKSGTDPEERVRVDISESLLRRGRLPEKKYLNPDGSAHSRVFKLREKDEGELSVDVESLTTPEKSIIDSSEFMLFVVPNKHVISIGLNSFHAPLPDNTNDAHAVIVGMTLEDDILPKLLAQESKRVIIR